MLMAICKTKNMHEKDKKARADCEQVNLKI